MLLLTRRLASVVSLFVIWGCLSPSAHAHKGVGGVMQGNALRQAWKSSPGNGMGTWRGAFPTKGWNASYRGKYNSYRRLNSMGNTTPHFANRWSHSGMSGFSTKARAGTGHPHWVSNNWKGNASHLSVPAIPPMPSIPAISTNQPFYNGMLNRGLHAPCPPLQMSPGIRQGIYSQAPYGVAYPHHVSIQGGQGGGVYANTSPNAAFYGPAVNAGMGGPVSAQISPGTGVMAQMGNQAMAQIVPGGGVFANIGNQLSTQVTPGGIFSRAGGSQVSVTPFGVQSSLSPGYVMPVLNPAIGIMQGVLNTVSGQ